MDSTCPQRADAEADAVLAAAPAPGLTLRAGEPAARSWREVTLAFLLELLQRSEVPAGQPRIVAIAGRSGSGKTTLVARLARAAPASGQVRGGGVRRCCVIFAVLRR